MTKTIALPTLSILTKIFVPLLIVAACATNVKAADTTTILLQLSSILGSKEACGIKFKEDAIRSYIIDQVTDNDVTFSARLTDYARVTRDSEIKAMSQGTLEAHCVLVRRFAIQHRFM